MNARLRAIVRREYLERVRTKAFVIGTLLGPVLMGALMIVPTAMARSGGKPLRVAVLDATGILQADVERTLREVRIEGRVCFDVRPAPGGEAESREAVLRKAVLAAELDGYVALPADAVSSSQARYYGRSVSNRIDLRLLERSLGEVLVASRLTAAGIDPARVKALTRDLDLRTIRLSAAGEREDGGAAFLFPVILMMILYSSILMWGQVVMTSVIEEKGSRVVEVIASGVPPTQLLWGKLLGVGGAGLTQFLVWSLSLVVVSVTAAGGTLLGGFRTPEVTPLVAGSFVLFFLLGFIFYGALYASVGAAVNTVQEAQNLAFPVLLPLIIGMVCFPAVLRSPDSEVAVGLSLVPFLSPILMFLRIVVLTPPWWQLALSLAFLALAIAGVLWAAGRIYRVGILMYGKRPTFTELIRWVRHA